MITTSATRWHTSSFTVSAILQKTPLWLHLKNSTFFIVILTDLGSAWFVFLGMVLGTKCRFFIPLFLYLGDKYVFLINMFITNDMYLLLHFFPALSLLWVYPVWVHSHCGLEVL